MSIVRLKPLPRARVAVLASGGGNSVATGDVCAEEGLEMPALSSQTRVSLTEYISLVNQGVINPLDVPGVLASVPLLRRTLGVLAEDPTIDLVILRLSPEFLAGAIGVSEFVDCVLGFARENAGGKQIVVAMAEEGMVGGAEKYADDLREAGITVYGSLRRACRALNKFSLYHRFVSESGAGEPSAPAPRPDSGPC
ncbi:MAG: hypothetical protein V3R87_10340, partial [Dehalococcoidia bacterium]